VVATTKELAAILVAHTLNASRFASAVFRVPSLPCQRCNTPHARALHPGVRVPERMSVACWDPDFTTRASFSIAFRPVQKCAPLRQVAKLRWDARLMMVALEW
jgi:hypothetical protein